MKKCLSVSIEPIWYNDNLDFFDRVLDQSDDLIICTLLWESPPLSEWQHRLEKLILRAKSVGKTVILIINSWYKKDKEILIGFGLDEVVFLDFFLTLVYIRLIKKQESPVRECLTTDCENWLFLTGKANKSNRLPLLYKFYQAQLLEKCQWSLFITDQVYDQCRQYLTDLDDDEADKWLKKFSRSPDNVEVIDSQEGIHCPPIPYGNIYQSCLFQVVSETSTDNVDNPWITEKTWLPIANHTPFLIFGDPNTNAKLKKMGFLTFDEFGYDNDFDNPLSMTERIESIIRNVRHWLENLSKNIVEISASAKHNHHRFLSLANENIEVLEKLRSKYKINEDIYSLVSFTDELQHAQWKNWYARIRDLNWPNCDKEEDFSKLPLWIQKECIEVFGYQYKGSK